MPIRLPFGRPPKVQGIAGYDARIVTPPLFIATKLEAFHGRGGDDLFTSHDLEDIIAVVDGRAEIIGSLLKNPDFIEALAGFLLANRCHGVSRSPGTKNGCISLYSRILTAGVAGPVLCASARNACSDCATMARARSFL